MSSSNTDDIAVARRYATAMFALAVESGKEAVFVAEIMKVASASASHEGLRTALANPLISRAEKAAILTKISASGDPLTQRSLAEVAAGGRASLLPVIATILEAELAAKRGVMVAEITSARPLSVAMQKQVTDALTKAIGKQVQIRMIEDPAVLGGMAVQLGSLRLDATLSGALNTLRNQLLAQPS